MKYSQYLEFEKVLKENNLAVDDVKENPEVLNEAGLGIIAAIAGGGLALLFRKQLLSWGVKAAYLSRLNKFLDGFRSKVLQQVSVMAKQSLKYRQNLLAKEKQLRADDSEEAAEERKALQVHKANYERRLTKEVNNFIDKMAELKSKEIYKKIEDLPLISEGHQMALKGYWEMKIPEIKLAAFKQLTDDGILTDKEVLATIKQEAEDIAAEAKANLKNIKKKITTEDTEKEGEEGKSLEETIEDNIQEMNAEKTGMKEEDLLRKIRMTLNDLKKVEDKDEQGRLFNMLKDAFGIDKIKSAQKVTIEPEAEKEPEIKQSVIDTEDKL